MKGNQNAQTSGLDPRWVHGRARLHIATQALVETANKRNRLHPRGQEHRAALTFTLTSHSLLAPNSAVAVMAHTRECTAVSFNGSPNRALVQGPPLQAIWSCIIRHLAADDRVADN